MKKLTVLLILVMLSGMVVYVASCGGGAGSAPQIASANANIAGKVTDDEVEDAMVMLYSTMSSTPIDTTRSGSEGEYSFTNVDLSQYGSGDMLYIIAEGGSVEGVDVDYLKFKSILGSGSDLQTAAADGNVSTADIPDLTVSNVTTAKVALVEKITGVEVDPETANLSASVDTLIESEGEQEEENMGLVISLAGVIKAAIDDSTTYGNVITGGSEDVDIDDFIRNSINVDANTDSISFTIENTELQEAGADLEDAIYEEDELIKSAAGTGGTVEEITASDIAGTWYGYHVDTWGDEENMGGPGLVDAELSASGGDCTSGQVYMVLTGDGGGDAQPSNQGVVPPGRVAGVEEESDIDITCGEIKAGSILKFSFDTPGPENETHTIEAVGKIEGDVINGTYAMKDSDGVAVTGGIFKLGKDTTEDFSGTYSLEGTYTALFLSEQAERDGELQEGDEHTIEGSIIVADDDTLSGTIVSDDDTSGTGTQMEGMLDGPRVKAKMVTGSTEYPSTVFLVFLINESDVTGLYMDFSGSYDDPDQDMAYSGGKFSFDEMEKTE